MAGSTGGIRTHDGFYFRFGLGIGGGSYAGRVHSSDPTADGAGIDARGVAIPLELSFGGTPVRGLVLGGGIFGATIPSPTTRLKNFGLTEQSDSGSVVLSSIGPFVDYYFDPQQGFHAEAAIAYAAATAAKSTASGVQIPDKDYSGSGWALMLGGGWESWVGEQWSVGVLGRLQYGHVSLDAKSGGDKADVNALFLALLATLTYH